MMQVKENGVSESCAVMAQIAVQNLPHSKESRLPFDVLLRENRIKFFTWESRRYDELFTSYLLDNWS